MFLSLLKKILLLIIFQIMKTLLILSVVLAAASATWPFQYGPPMRYILMPRQPNFMAPQPIHYGGQMLTTGPMVTYGRSVPGPMRAGSMVTGGYMSAGSAGLGPVASPMHTGGYMSSFSAGQVGQALPLQGSASMSSIGSIGTRGSVGMIPPASPTLYRNGAAGLTGQFPPIGRAGTVVQGSGLGREVGRLPAMTSGYVDPQMTRGLSYMGPGYDYRYGGPGMAFEDQGYMSSYDGLYSGMPMIGSDDFEMGEYLLEGIRIFGPIGVNYYKFKITFIFVC